MRVVSGIYKSRRINVPANLPVRPTTDFAKESLFNILNNRIHFEEISVLDLFAGTGSISLEFISRGAKDAVCVDVNFSCIKFIKKIIEEFKLENLHPVNKNVFTYLNYCQNKFDIIFADPPYDMEGIETIPEIVFSKNILNKNGWLIVEHSNKINFSQHQHFCELRKYGNVNFSLFYL
ncbi:MAG: 16S rRNA (guanine(966)-N(2))-methyltransferase RsmD [Bacteroidales bacterium]|jgi:16S rRNA (guanine(966)-N(2))-methyltransferase RsmD